MSETSALIGATMGAFTMLETLLDDKRVRRDLARELKADPVRHAQVTDLLSRLQVAIRGAE